MPEQYSTIGQLNEQSLHAAVKQWYAGKNSLLEAKLEGYFIDILNDNEVIEIQTRNFGSIKKKLDYLTDKYPVKLVYPIPTKKWIVHYTEDMTKQIRKRRSPKKGKLTDLFDELIRIPHIVKKKNFCMEVLFHEQEEIRCDDGKGSWRRKGVSIKDRRLVKVSDTLTFKKPGDYRRFIPGDIAASFTNKQLASSCKIPVEKARKLTYCLDKIGVITKTGKKGNAIIYKLV